MDQEQVDIGQAQLAQALVHGALRLVVAMPVVPQLGGDEQILAGYPRSAQPLAHAGLVAIDGSRVDRAVAGRQCGLDAGGRLVVGNLPHPQAQLGHCITVVQLQYRYLRHKTLPGVDESDGMKNLTLLQDILADDNPVAHNANVKACFRPGFPDRRPCP
ncbi:Uncharacterised protein [Bordetella pertussis]|nr:Uncharacterised protein [Bordetella pertussis]